MKKRRDVFEGLSTPPHKDIDHEEDFYRTVVHPDHHFGIRTGAEGQAEQRSGDAGI